MFSLPHDTNLSISIGLNFMEIILKFETYLAKISGFFLPSMSSIFQIIIVSLLWLSVPTVTKSLLLYEKLKHLIST